MTDHKFMYAALALADEPEYSPSPNSRVGAVIVRDGAIIARGVHGGLRVHSLSQTVVYGA